MPLYQQGGLGEKGTLQGLPQIVEAFLNARSRRKEEDFRRRQLELNEMLGRENLDLSRRRTAAAETSAEATKLLREYQLGRLQQPEPETAMTLEQITASLPQGMTWTGTAGPEGTFTDVSFKPLPVGQTINVDVATGDTPLEKSTKGYVEREIESIDKILLNLGEVEKLTEDSFLTYPGRMGASAQRLGEKVTGGPVFGSEFLGRYSAWKVMSQEMYLQKRHEITGVAANPSEKVEIAEAIPDPAKNSPTEFRAKQQQLKKILQAHKDRLTRLRARGIPNPTKEQLSAEPLYPTPSKQQTQPQDYTDAELKTAIGMARRRLPSGASDTQILNKAKEILSQHSGKIIKNGNENKR